MKWAPVQIPVVAVWIQMRTLKTEVEKGSMWTLVEHGLVDPKVVGNSVTKSAYSIFVWIFRCTCNRKGKGLKFLYWDVDNMRQRKWTRRRLLRLWEEFSFLFNSCSTLEAVHPEMRSFSWQSILFLGCLVRFNGPLKIRGKDLLTLLVVLISASGLQG